jgi:hypothetical protein
MEQRAYAYAALVEDCERVVDESGSADVTLRGLHGCGSLRPTYWTYLGAVGGCVMPYTVDFNTVSTVGLESSPVAAALAGLRAHPTRVRRHPACGSVGQLEAGQQDIGQLARVRHPPQPRHQEQVLAPGARV